MSRPDPALVERARQVVHDWFASLGAAAHWQEEALADRVAAFAAEVAEERGWRDEDVQAVLDAKDRATDFYRASETRLRKALLFAIGDLGPARRHVVRIMADRPASPSPVIAREIGAALERCAERLAALAEPPG